MTCAFLLQGNKKELLEIKTFKRQYLPHYQPENGFNGTFVEHAMSSLHGGSFEIMLAVPLNCRIMIIMVVIISLIMQQIELV